MADLAAKDMHDILLSLAPATRPQLFPRQPHTQSYETPTTLKSLDSVLLALKSNKQRSLFVEHIKAHLSKVEKEAGEERIPVPLTTIDIVKRVVSIDEITFVGKIEANLLSTAFVSRLASEDHEMMEPYFDFFMLRNRTEDIDSIYQVYNLAYSLQVLIDNIPGWSVQFQGAPANGLKSDDIDRLVSNLLSSSNEKPAMAKKRSREPNNKKAQTPTKKSKGTKKKAPKP